EWNIDQITQRVAADPSLADQVAGLLLNGARDPVLQTLVPRYYLETLNLNAFLSAPLTARRVRYKQSLAGTYSGRKGYRVEALVREQLEGIQRKHGVSFERGTTRLVNVNADFAIPTLEDPWVIVMCSFQETTSSGQSTKARDMEAAYRDVCTSNSRHKENRAFVNFADGGGWLARKRDFERLVRECHYFINLKHLVMLESIVLDHVPRKYFRL
ncbi:MAG: DpnII family type II restriction endonuclease, partial [Anaerolineae bacterium]|nr:DpnII family type II restriction endonuclease [Anaerolineae bacterium]